MASSAVHGAGAERLGVLPNTAPSSRLGAPLVSMYLFVPSSFAHMRLVCQTVLVFTQSQASYGGLPQRQQTHLPLRNLQEKLPGWEGGFVPFLRCCWFLCYVENHSVHTSRTAMFSSLFFVRDGIHSVADYNSTRMGVGVVVVVVVVVYFFTMG